MCWEVVYLMEEVVCHWINLACRFNFEERRFGRGHGSGQDAVRGRGRPFRKRKGQRLRGDRQILSV